VPHYAVSAIGRDRPGIVAALTRVLLEVGGNIEDSRMSILRGHFAVMLIVAVPGSVEAERLERDLAAVRAELGLEALAVNPVKEVEPAGAAATHTLTVYGADHPGIVHAVAEALAERGVNITDLETRLTGDPGNPLYVIVMEVAVGDTDERRLAEALGAVGEDARVDVSLRPLEVETL
jgi:glycine cleavage system transcriptional repressor